jgi:hypothetical protein
VDNFIWLLLALVRGDIENFVPVPALALGVCFVSGLAGDFAIMALAMAETATAVMSICKKLLRKGRKVIYGFLIVKLIGLQPNNQLENNSIQALIGMQYTRVHLIQQPVAKHFFHKSIFIP